MASRADVTSHLRDHIVGGMHVGQLCGGDRLPSIRDVARQLNKNPRTVKAAYAALQREGLVEVRGRSGVFVAHQEVLSGETTEETARWLCTVITEGWKRRISVGALPQIIERVTASRPVCCALVESVEDAAVALKHELEHDWGFAVRVMAPEAIAAARDVEFFAATSFHAAAIHARAEALGKPLVVITVHTVLKNALESRIAEGGLNVVALDPQFAERIRISYAPADPARVRYVSAHDRAAVAALDPEEPVLFTRAARQKLGHIRPPMVFPHSPTISQETARMLANILVRRNVEAVR